MFSQEVKVGQVKSNQTCYSEWSTLQIWWTGFLMFSPGRQFLSNTIYFSNDFATLRCSKFIIFTLFLVFQKIYPKSDAERCRPLRTKGLTSLSLGAVSWSLCTFINSSLTSLSNSKVSASLCTFVKNSFLSLSYGAVSTSLCTFVNSSLPSLWRL